MKVKMLATGNVEEIAAGFAQRLYEAGQAVFVKEEKAKEKAEEPKAEVVVMDKLPETEPEAEPESKPAKGRKSK